MISSYKDTNGRHERQRGWLFQRGNGVESSRSGGAPKASGGLVTSLEIGPAGAHQDHNAITVTNTAPVTTAAITNANTRLISFSIR